jgi:hypothetical protein
MGHNKKRSNQSQLTTFFHMSVGSSCQGHLMHGAEHCFHQGPPINSNEAQLPVMWLSPPSHPTLTTHPSKVQRTAPKSHNWHTQPGTLVTNGAVVKFSPAQDRT